MSQNSEDDEEFDSFSVKLEGYDVSLELTIDANLNFSERSAFMKEVISNYLFAMKTQGLISGQDDNIIIIDEKDWDILRNYDSVLLESQRKILLGFSGYNILKSKYSEKNDALNKLNREMFNKSYELVEKSLTKVRRGTRDGSLNLGQASFNRPMAGESFQRSNSKRIQPETSGGIGEETPAQVNLRKESYMRDSFFNTVGEFQILPEGMAGDEDRIHSPGLKKHESKNELGFITGIKFFLRG
jgi:hypothetical protein